NQHRDPEEADQDRSRSSYAGHTRGFGRAPYCPFSGRPPSAPVGRPFRYRGSENERTNGDDVEDGARLMERVRARDVAAFEQLYDGYHRLVFGIALRIASDATLAEDVTQSIFLRLWSAPEGFREGNFAAWLSRVTRNRTLDA